jgi:ACR3 family arsenite efflux pump ArsB
MDYGNRTALGYSVTAKAHAITIGVASTAFAGTLAVLPAAVAAIVQIPIMMAILTASGRIQRFLGFCNDASRPSHSIVCLKQKM